MEAIAAFAGVSAYQIALLLGAMSILGAFAAATLIAAGSLSNTEKRRLARDDSWIARRLRNGFSFARPFAQVLLEEPHIRKLSDETVWLLFSRGFVSTPEAFASVLCVALLLVAILSSLVAGTPVCGIAVSICVVGALAAFVHTVQEKHTRAMREAVPDILRAMESCFGVGFSLQQTLQHVADETEGDLQSVFSRSVHILETGGTAAQALLSLRQGSTVPELAFVAVALDVQHQSGGSMGRVLEAARDTVESELELARSLQVQTAQAKLSARIVSIMPFLLIAVFSLISEDFLAPFFASVLGMSLLAIALVMQVAGILMVRRMLKVRME